MYLTDAKQEMVTAYATGIPIEALQQMVKFEQRMIQEKQKGFEEKKRKIDSRIFQPILKIPHSKNDIDTNIRANTQEGQKLALSTIENLKKSGVKIFGFEEKK